MNLLPIIFCITQNAKQERRGEKEDFFLKRLIKESEENVNENENEKI
jgi:hypothetical protein